MENDNTKYSDEELIKKYEEEQRERRHQTRGSYWEDRTSLDERDVPGGDYD